MVSILALWLPILLSAVGVFVTSSIIHMVLRYHSTDFKKLPREAETMDALRPLAIPPGEYVMPHAVGTKEMSSPEFVEKQKQGPVAVMTVLRNGPFAMGPTLAWWFVYCVVVGVFAAYVGGQVLPVGVHYLKVFQIVGAVAFTGYSLALWQNTIWYKRALSTSLKNTFDGLVYALITAGVFGWLWPT